MVVKERKRSPGHTLATKPLPQNGVELGEKLEVPKMWEVFFFLEKGKLRCHLPEPDRGPWFDGAIKEILKIFTLKDEELAAILGRLKDEKRSVVKEYTCQIAEMKRDQASEILKPSTIKVGIQQK
jgi:hypothetical protein